MNPKSIARISGLVSETLSTWNLILPAISLTSMGAYDVLLYVSRDMQIQRDTALSNQIYVLRTQYILLTTEDT